MIIEKSYFAVDSNGQVVQFDTTQECADFLEWRERAAHLSGRPEHWKTYRRTGPLPAEVGDVTRFLLAGRTEEEERATRLTPRKGEE